MPEWDEESQAPVLVSHGSADNSRRQGSSDIGGPSRAWSIGSYVWPFSRWRQQPLAEQAEDFQLQDDSEDHVDTSVESAGEQTVAIEGSESHSQAGSGPGTLSRLSSLSGSPDRRLGIHSPGSSAQSTPQRAGGPARLLLGRSPLRRAASQDGWAEDSNPSTPLLSDAGLEDLEVSRDATVFSAPNEASSVTAASQEVGAALQPAVQGAGGSGRFFSFAPVSEYVQRISSTLRKSSSSMTIDRQSSYGDSQV